MTDSGGTFLPSRITDASRISGTVCFRSGSTAGSVHSVYFLPFAWSFDAGSGSYHSHFLSPDHTPPLLPWPLPSSASSSYDAPVVVNATFLAFDAFSSFDERGPMEMVASEAETTQMLARAGRADYLAFAAYVENTTQQVRLPLLMI